MKKKTVYRNCPVKDTELHHCHIAFTIHLYTRLKDYLIFNNNSAVYSYFIIKKHIYHIMQKVDYLDVDNAGNSICCLSSPTTSSVSPTKRRSPLSKKPILSRSEVSNKIYMVSFVLDSPYYRQS